ncbi:hypothetical protein AXW67_17455 [Bradyrhizobium neotropicale]|uniref:Uncharacterized protein n=1 Tax=Bradyrhizobium neotropicale TaxID=1497615 RepID=A0A176Z211_9BRAD|nr:hypothetical protein AXW67_17455 [Bradyrhizobium neotropicale]
MLFAGGAKRSLRDTYGAADFGEIKRPVGICRQKILETSDDRIVVTVTRFGFYADAVGETSDHDMDEFALQCAKHLRDLQHIWSVMGELSDRSVQLQQPRHQLRVWMNNTLI